MNTDRILEAAEHELNLRPEPVNLPAGFDYPPAVLKELEAADKLWQTWATANSVVADKQHALMLAGDADRAAVLAAAKAGKKEHPGRAATEHAELELEFAIAQCQVAREAATAAAKGRILEVLAREGINYRDQAEQAIDDAELFAEQAVAKMRDLITEINARRNRARHMAAHVATQAGARVDRALGQYVRMWSLPDEFDPRLTSVRSMLNSQPN